MGYLFERVVTTKVLQKLFDVEVTKVLLKSLVVVHTVLRKCINQFEVYLCLELVLGRNTHAGLRRVACLVLVRRCFVFRKPVDKGVTWRWMSGFLEKLWIVLIADVSKIDISKPPLVFTFVKKIFLST